MARDLVSRNRVERRRAVALGMLFGIAVSLFASGCLSPTLPLPPPSQPEVSAPNADGNVRISGVVQSRATVFALNQRTDQIVGEVTGHDGAYDLSMRAEVGDRISVWQSIRTKESGTVEVVVPEVTPMNGTPPAPMGGGSGE